MKYRGVLLGVYFIIGIFIIGCQNKKPNVLSNDTYSGSESCIECHERFYKLWAPSFHGKAMQPVNPGFISEYRLPSSEPMAIEDFVYKVEYEDSAMVLHEKQNGELINKYPVVWSLGGRNVFCFLVPLDKGRLQTMPLAYDMNRKIWFNYPESAVRHFVDTEERDEALPWKDRMYTFNTGCYNCHISQLSSNFNLETETYQTTWKEAGINCETCHGPSTEHVRIFKNLKEGEEPESLGLISTKVFTAEQHNASCAPCHAKTNPITSGYTPGDPYFDHFNLAALEDLDFYPDGRDLGENYTYTGWMMNECKGASDLNCVTCHTSSGRNRFKENPNDACTSCHENRKEDLMVHTMHKPDSPGSTCVNCHAPSREFVGHFIRSDHSFRPPMPEATIRFGSPNACNQCHENKSPEWANNIVKKRSNGNYQKETLYWAQLIKEARDNDWHQLDEMLRIIKESQLNEVVVASLIRLVANCQDENKWLVLIEALNNESPMIRSSAATGLAGRRTNQVKNALIAACNDKSRVVRVSAALSITAFLEGQISEADRYVVDQAVQEYKNSLVTRPDDWSAHYNMGIFHQNSGDATSALNSYEIASRLYPEALMPLINSSVLYSSVGNVARAEENLRLAVSIDPENEAANLNLGLLLAEKGNIDDAKKALISALRANPNQAVAAYNLSVLSAKVSISDAVKYAKIAADASPNNPRYAYTLAFYQNEAGDINSAIRSLKKVVDRFPQHLSSVYFLAEIYSKKGEKEKAINLYKNLLNLKELPEIEKIRIQKLLQNEQM